MDQPVSIHRNRSQTSKSDKVPRKEAVRSKGVKTIRFEVSETGGHRCVERLEHVVHPWGTKGPSGRSLRGRSAQAQVQVRGYKEEKLELAARTLCFICPSFASCALVVRCLFTQCSPLVLSLSLSLCLYTHTSLSLSPPLLENLASSNRPSLEPDDPPVYNLFVRSCSTPRSASSATRPGRCCIFINS